MHLCTASIAKFMNVYMGENVSVCVCMCVAQAISVSQSRFGVDVQLS